MRLVFLGTPAFAVATLEATVRAGHQVAAVLTQPDRPRGRGQNAAASPVKQAALRLGLAVYQPERVRRPEAVEYLRGIGCDAMVVVGYGQIIPQVVIDLAPLGIINVHASLLPKYRGAGPIQWAIARGETRTGVTTMRIDAGLDTGDMLLKAETEIGPEENAVELGARLAVMGADLLVETLAGLLAGKIVPEKQDDAQATLAPLLKKEDGAIDWTESAQAIHNRVRGLQPWPGAQTGFRGQPLHLWKTRCGGALLRAGKLPGQLVSQKPPVVACGEGVLELIEVQLEGRKRISSVDFANGQRLTDNDILGEPLH
ncbi:MAG: methionyl-tRNA formyltransferase [Candidatus Solibacter sp.]|nr:methionyl-tRNA formyltransferase [Candidatus Solibacter sp.]